MSIISLKSLCICNLSKILEFSVISVISNRAVFVRHFTPLEIHDSTKQRILLRIFRTTTDANKIRSAFEKQYSRNYENVNKLSLRARARESPSKAPLCRRVMPRFRETRCRGKYIRVARGRDSCSALAAAARRQKGIRVLAQRKLRAG